MPTPSNIDVISDLVAEEGVDALISVEPIIAIMDKSLQATYDNGTYQSGSTIKIRLEDQPMMPTLGNVMQVDPVQQGEISATAFQYNDGILLGTLEELYNLGGKELVSKRILRPRMKNMAVQGAILAYNEICTFPNFFGTAGTAVKTSQDWGAGAAVLNDQLANDEGLYAIMSNQAMNETAGSLAAAFNPTTESATAYMKGRVKEAAGLNFFSTSNLPNHTNGSAVGDGLTGMVLSASMLTGATTVAVTGGTTTGQITQDSLLWFKAGYAVQPNTKKTLSTLRYVNVVSSVTLSGGAGTVTFYPPLYGPENPKMQNISALPVASTSYVGIVGTASHTYEQAVVMKKGSSSFTGLKLPELTMQKNSSASIEGVKIMVASGSDIINRQNITRWDILCAVKNLQWRHGARAFTRDLG